MFDSKGTKTRNILASILAGTFVGHPFDFPHILIFFSLVRYRLVVDHRCYTSISCFIWFQTNLSSDWCHWNIRFDLVSFEQSFLLHCKFQLELIPSPILVLKTMMHQAADVSVNFVCHCLVSHRCHHLVVVVVFLDARLFLLFSFILLFGSLIASAWVLFGFYLPSKKMNLYPGIAIFGQNLAIAIRLVDWISSFVCWSSCFSSTLILKFGRKEVFLFWLQSMD